MNRKRSSKSLRHQARRLAVQAIYQWMFTDKLAPAIIEEFESNSSLDRIDIRLFEDLVNGVTNYNDQVDDIMSRFISCHLSELTAVEAAVLKIATYELHHHLATPYRVVINEALELTKTFGTDQGYRFVNGVLDEMAQVARASEM